MPTSLFSPSSVSAFGPLRVLAITGGGFMGLYSAQVLARLEAEAGEPIGRRFDFIVGTSIGGLVATGVALEIPMAEVVRVFEEWGPRIFPPEKAALRNGGWNQARDLIAHRRQARYSSRVLRSAITELVDDEAILADVKHSLAVPALNMTNGRLELFRAGYGEMPPRPVRLVDMALATSAAPTFFELGDIDGELYADGGLFAHSPELLALQEAELCWNLPASDVTMLSIGSPHPNYAFGQGSRRNLGILDWMGDQRLLGVVWAAQQQFAEELAGQRLGPRVVRLRHQAQNPEGPAPGFDVTSPAVLRFMRMQATNHVAEALAGPFDWFERPVAPVAPVVPAKAGPGPWVDWLEERRTGLTAKAKRAVQRLRQAWLESFS